MPTLFISGLQLVCNTGEGCGTAFNATCSVRLPGRLAEVQLTARTEHQNSSPAHDTAQTAASSHSDSSDSRLSSIQQLAQFLAELSPQGGGGFDTSCLVEHNNQAAAAEATAASQSKDPLLSNKGTVPAVLQQASAGTTRHNPWLTPAVAAFTSHASTSSSQQVCFAQKTQHSLGDVLRYSPQALQRDEERRLVLFQVLCCLHSLHNESRHLGGLNPDSVCLSRDR